jgi:hypothetical protein
LAIGHLLAFLASSRVNILGGRIRVMTCLIPYFGARGAAADACARLPLLSFQRGKNTRLLT